VGLGVVPLATVPKGVTASKMYLMFIVTFQNLSAFTLLEIRRRRWMSVMEEGENTKVNKGLHLY
jgi:hypothetical protein